MRWISVATVLSAALLPAVSARPLCRPDKPTTTSGVLTTTAATSVETLSTDIATTAETSATYETTSAFETTVTETATATSGITTELETTITESETATATATTDATTINFETTVTEFVTSAETTVAEATTTTTEAAEPSNYVQNANFDEETNVDWSFRSAEIKTDSTRAHSSDKYVELKIVNDYAQGGNQVNQTINGLSTDRLFRLSFSGAVFSEPMPVIPSGVECSIQAYQDGSEVHSWTLDTTTLDQYSSYGWEFTPNDEDITLSLRLRCTGSQRLTIDVGVDDVSLVEAGPAPPV